MKRILLFLVALFTISTMVAEITIPTEFDGIVLGKSSRNEVREMLTSKGLVYSQEQSESDDYGCSDVYEGEYLHNGMNFDCVFTRFVGDTIVSVCFKGKYSDVLDSEVAECDFTDLYMRSISRPSKIDEALRPVESEMKQQTFEYCKEMRSTRILAIIIITAVSACFSRSAS